MRSPKDFRNLILFMLAIFICRGTSPIAVGQDSSLDVAATNKADQTAYRIFFRQVNAYKKMADDAKATHQDKEFLRKVAPELVEINDADVPNLERIAVACSAELTALHVKVLQVIRQFQAEVRTPGHKDTGPPPELADLQAQEIAIVLRYRDTLRNAMVESEFQRVQEEVRKRLGTTPLSPTGGL